MLRLFKYLSSFFDGNSYQSRLDRYISSRYVTDASQVEYYVKEFERNQHRAYLWKTFYTKFIKHLQPSVVSLRNTENSNTA